MTVTLSTNRLRQLNQIRRHSPALFVDTQTSLSRFPTLADSIISKAMRLLADDLQAKAEVEEQTFVSGPEYFVTCPGCSQSVEEDVPCADCDQPTQSEIANPKAHLWGLIETLITNQELEALSGKSQLVWEYDGTKYFIHRDKHHDDLRLYSRGREYRDSSRPVGRWGRDWNKLSSAQAGCWKLTDEARGNFDIWMRVSQ